MKMRDINMITRCLVLLIPFITLFHWIHLEDGPAYSATAVQSEIARKSAEVEQLSKLIVFEKDSYDLTYDGCLALEKVADILLSLQPNIQLEISAEMFDFSESTKVLATNRSQTIFNFLEKIGVPETRMSIQAGEVYVPVEQWADWQIQLILVNRETNEVF